MNGEPTGAAEILKCAPVRLAGKNRLETAAAVSSARWATAAAAGDIRAHARAVVLSRDDTFADALGGAALAAARIGPLLMAPGAALAASVSDEIKRVLGSDPTKTVYLLGGTGALSPAAENAVESLGYRPVRLSGNDRFQTSVAIANAIDSTPDLVLAAT